MSTIQHTNAFHGDPAIKAKLIEAIEQDQAADAIRQGSYLEKNPDNPVGFTACAVGCAVAAFRGTQLQDNWHGVLEEDTDIPAQINHIIDGMFESLSKDKAPQFTLDVFSAIQPGADLSLVVSNLMLDVLVGEPYGLTQLPELAEDVKAAVEAVAGCYRRRLAGDEPTEAEWDVAGDLAWDARAARAARAAWAARAARAAWAARDAWDAWDAWDARAARDAYLPWIAERFIHHLASAPVAVALAK